MIIRIKSESVIRRFEKFLCFTLASINYYEDLLHKLSILFVYFPLATDGKKIWMKSCCDEMNFRSKQCC